MDESGWARVRVRVVGGWLGEGGGSGWVEVVGGWYCGG